VLHVAALPFPSYQGTQAAIRAMLEASTRSGRHAELFAYAASGYSFAADFALHRTGNFPRVTSLRSGPSLGKLLLDARMLLELRTLVARLQPRAIVAHHVEAAALALALRCAPTVFFAHTDLETELPSYAHRRFQPALAWAGKNVDRVLAGRADAVATISPALRQRWLSTRLAAARPNAGATTQAAIYVPTPWQLPAAIQGQERTASRRALGLAADSCVALYAGNLDAYQDPCSALDALRILIQRGIRITLLLATNSEPTSFIQRAARLGIPFRTSSLDGESVRRGIHAAADLAIVPRGPEGGLPIKLLDALARGVPCAVSPHAAAGCDLAAVSACAREQGAAALARAVASLAADPELRRTLAARGRAYVSREHSDSRFVSALDAALLTAAGTHSRARGTAR
jgi:colanic acid biosynthesis glycosyl transferase WcaI